MFFFLSLKMNEAADTALAQIEEKLSGTIQGQREEIVKIGVTDTDLKQIKDYQVSILK